jgi:predicted kinase
MTLPDPGKRLPPLVVVSGPPGAGKTTLATMLSRALRLPVIAKDLIKEPLMDHFGGGEPAGRAAYAVQFAVAEAMLQAGCGLILEGPFFQTQPGLDTLTTLAYSVGIHVGAPMDCLLTRYASRAGDRHPGHRGLEALPDLRARIEDGTYDPPGLGLPVLRVDAANGYRPRESEIVSWLVEQLA